MSWWDTRGGVKEIDVFNPKERRQRIELLELRAKLYRKAHKAGNLTPEQKKDYLIDLREIERLKRIDRSEDDVLYFRRFGVGVPSSISIVVLRCLAIMSTSCNFFAGHFVAHHIRFYHTRLPTIRFLPIRFTYTFQ